MDESPLKAVHLRAFSRLTAILATFAMVVLILPLGGATLLIALDVLSRDVLDIDFTAFWGAARLALDGRAIEAFDTNTLLATVDASDLFFWMYPPTWHLAITPLGALPFWAAYPLFTYICLFAYLYAMRPHCRALIGQLNLVVAAPVVLLSALNGNNSLLTAGVFVLAMTALGSGRERRAGLLIALLSVKPTLGALIPLALALGGHWRAFTWASIGVVGLALVATAIFGLDYWAAFFAAAEGNTAFLLDAWPADSMVSWFGFARIMGLSGDAAFALHCVALVVAGAAVAYAWRGEADWRWRAAVLAMAIPLSTPYAHYYEMTFTLAGVVFALAAGLRNWPMLAAAAAVWLAPAAVMIPGASPVLAMTAPPIATAALLICAVSRPPQPAEAA